MSLVGWSFSSHLLFEYEPARNCSPQRGSACQHPDYDTKDLRMLDWTLMWRQVSSCMPVDTQSLYLFTLWTCSKHKTTWDSRLPSMPQQPQAIPLMECWPQDKSRNMDRYHLPDATQNLLSFCNFMLCQSTNGSDGWQWQRLNCPRLQDFVLRSLGAAHMS